MKNKLNLKNKIAGLVFVFVTFMSLVSFSYAEKEIFTKPENASFYSSFFKQIKNIFNADSLNQNDNEKPIISPMLKEPEKQTPKNLSAPVLLPTPVLLLKEDVLIGVYATSTENTILINTQCESQIKVNQKKEKINKQIKTQIRDKNKLVDSMFVVSASSSDDFKKVIDSKVIKLESDVSDIIKTQKNLIGALASSGEYDCVVKQKPLQKKEVFIISDSENQKKLSLENENNIKIRKIENDINKKSSEINSFIKVDIKNILESIQE